MSHRPINNATLQGMFDDVKTRTSPRFKKAMDGGATTGTREAPHPPRSKRKIGSDSPGTGKKTKPETEGRDERRRKREESKGTIRRQTKRTGETETPLKEQSRSSSSKKTVCEIPGKGRHNESGIAEGAVVEGARDQKETRQKIPKLSKEAYRLDDHDKSRNKKGVISKKKKKEGEHIIASVTETDGNQCDKKHNETMNGTEDVSTSTGSGDDEGDDNGSNAPASKHATEEGVGKNDGESKTDLHHGTATTDNDGEEKDVSSCKAVGGEGDSGKEIKEDGPKYTGGTYSEESHDNNTVDAEQEPEKGDSTATGDKGKTETGTLGGAGVVTPTAEPVDETVGMMDEGKIELEKFMLQVGANHVAFLLERNIFLGSIQHLRKRYLSLNDDLFVGKIADGFLEGEERWSKYVLRNYLKDIGGEAVLKILSEETLAEQCRSGVERQTRRQILMSDDDIIIECNQFVASQHRRLEHVPCGPSTDATTISPMEGEQHGIPDTPGNTEMVDSWGKTEEETNVADECSKHSKKEDSVVGISGSIKCRVGLKNAVSSAIRHGRVTNTTGCCRDKYGTVISCCCLDKFCKDDNLLSGLECLVEHILRIGENRDKKKERSVFSVGKGDHLFVSFASQKAIECFRSVYGNRHKDEVIRLQQEEELSKRCIVDADLVEYILRLCYVVPDVEGSMRSRPIVLISGVLNEGGELGANIKNYTCLNGLSNVVRQVIIELSDDEQAGKNIFMRRYHGSFMNAESIVMVCRDSSLRRDLFLNVVLHKIKNPATKYIKWAELSRELNKKSLVSNLKRPKDTFRNWGLHNILVIHPKWRDCANSVLQTTAAKLVKSLAGSMVEFTDPVKRLLKDMGSDELFKFRFDGRADGAFHYVSTYGKKSFKDFITAANMGNSKDASRKLASREEVDLLHKEIGSCLREAVANNAKVDWMGGDDNFCIAATLGVTYRQTLQAPHYDFRMPKDKKGKVDPTQFFTLAELEKGSGRKGSAGRSAARTKLSPRDVGYIGFFPVTESGMFVQLWEHGSGTKEGIVTFIPFGVCLVVGGNTVHSGGFVTSSNGNRRAHFYAYNSKNPMIARPSNEEADEEVYIHNQNLLLAHEYEANKSQVCLSRNFFGKPFRNCIRDGFLES